MYTHNDDDFGLCYSHVRWEPCLGICEDVWLWVGPIKRVLFVAPIFIGENEDCGGIKVHVCNHACPM